MFMIKKCCLVCFSFVPSFIPIPFDIGITSNKSLKLIVGCFVYPKNVKKICLVWN